MIYNDLQPFTTINKTINNHLQWLTRWLTMIYNDLQPFTKRLTMIYNHLQDD